MARRRGELVKAGGADGAGAEMLPLVPEAGAGLGILGPAEVMEGPGEVLEGPGGAPAERPEDVLAEPPDARDISAELAAPPRRKLPWLTLLLSAGVVAAAAFTGGALVEKQHLRNSPGPAGSAGRGATFSGGTGAGARTGAGAGGGTAPGTAGSGLTFGTIKLVDGKTIYVTDAQGSIVKVTTGSATKVTESKDGKVGDLQPGQTVTIRGDQKSNGDIAATTVTEGGATGGGFGGFGGFGGGRSGGN